MEQLSILELFFPYLPIKIVCLLQVGCLLFFALLGLISSDPKTKFFYEKRRNLNFILFILSMLLIQKQQSDTEKVAYLQMALYFIMAYDFLKNYSIYQGQGSLCQALVGVASWSVVGGFPVYLSCQHAIICFNGRAGKDIHS